MSTEQFEQVHLKNKNNAFSVLETRNRNYETNSNLWANSTITQKIENEKELLRNTIWVLPTMYRRLIRQ